MPDDQRAIIKFQPKCQRSNDRSIDQLKVAIALRVMSLSRKPADYEGAILQIASGAGAEAIDRSEASTEGRLRKAHHAGAMLAT